MSKANKPDIASLVREGTFDREEVVEIIGTVLEKMESGPAGHSDILNNIKDLRGIIQNARKEIGREDVGDIKSKHIPVATDELDAVVGATEDATGRIMDACEIIQAYLGRVADGSVAGKINEQVMRIFEACSFQDITGQRITKVVKALKQIEEKIAALLDDDGRIGYIANDTADDRSEDDKLLNGPQLEGKGVSQSDVDKILSGSD